MRIFLNSLCLPNCRTFLVCLLEDLHEHLSPAILLTLGILFLREHAKSLKCVSVAAMHCQKTKLHFIFLKRIYQLNGDKQDLGRISVPAVIK